MDQNQQPDRPDNAKSSEVLPPIVKETLSSSTESRAGVSFLAAVRYQSLSGNLKNRDILIRRVIKHRNAYYLDVLAMDVHSPRLISVSQISFIRDKNSVEGYSNPYRFLQEVLGVDVDNSLLPDEMSDFAKVIKETGDELTVLMYLIAVDGIRSSAEREKVLIYVKQRVPYLKYDELQLNDYLISLAPDEDSFSMAFQHVMRKGIVVIQPFMETVLKIIMADGHVHEKERAFLARLIDTLKQAGYAFRLPE